MGKLKFGTFYSFTLFNAFNITWRIITLRILYFLKFVTILRSEFTVWNIIVIYLFRDFNYWDWFSHETTCRTYAPTQFESTLFFFPIFRASFKNFWIIMLHKMPVSSEIFIIWNQNVERYKMNIRSAWKQSIKINI